MEIISSTVVAFSRVWYHPLHQNSKFESVSDGCKTTVAQKGQSQISLPKHKTISQNTNQFSKTQISLPKHKTISQNTNQFTKTQINFSKHKPISSKHKSKDWALEIVLCFGKLICVLENCFVFWEIVLCFGKLICVLEN